MDNLDKQYMLRAIELAKRARGFTNPNPMVGAVIVKDGRIIGEGYHERCGELHAERNAIASLQESAKGATIYVTLEPCCHYGKTPPCTEAIIENEISRVVIGSRDPNPLVAGKGAAILREHGIEVTEDCLREECDELNPVFFHYISTRMPYVVMKYAMTMDGKIATKTGASKWISGDTSREYVHHMRHNYMAIMAGIGTVLADDPMLNVRLIGLKSPVRVICDSKLSIPLDSNIVKTAKEYRTIIAFAKRDYDKEAKLLELGLELEYVPSNTEDTTGNNGQNDKTTVIQNQVDIRMLLKRLGELSIDSVLVEGGGTLNDSLIREKLVNRVDVFIAPKIFGSKDAKSPVEGIGIEAVNDAAYFRLKSVEQSGEDVHLIYEAI